MYVAKKSRLNRRRPLRYIKTSNLPFRSESKSVIGETYDRRTKGNRDVWFRVPSGVKDEKGLGRE